MLPSGGGGANWEGDKKPEGGRFNIREGENSGGGVVGLKLVDPREGENNCEGAGERVVFMLRLLLEERYDSGGVYIEAGLDGVVAVVDVEVEEEEPDGGGMLFIK